MLICSSNLELLIKSDFELTFYMFQAKFLLGLPLFVDQVVLYDGRKWLGKGRILICI